MLRFNEADLVRQLSALPTGRLLSFAAACAQRLQPVYAAYCGLTRKGSPLALAAALGEVWWCAAGSRSVEVQEPDDLAESLRPYLDVGEPWRVVMVHAENAVDAVCLALFALESQAPDQSEYAARAAKWAFGTACYYVTEVLGVDPPGDQEHPLVQAELNRQAEDLRELAESTLPIEALVVRIRDRARQVSSRTV